MIWCANCTKQQESQLADSGLVCCRGCGKVVHQHIYLEESSSINGAERKGNEKYEAKLAGLAIEEGDKRKHLLGACKSNNADTPKLRDAFHDMSDNSGESCEDSESLSDIDDAEVSRYLLKEEERRYKKIIWEKMNQDYLKERAEKKAAAAKAAKLRKERQRQAKEFRKRQGGGAKATSAIAVKRTSSKVNYDALQLLLDEPEASDHNAKKRRTTAAFLEEESSSKNDLHLDEIYGDEEGGADWNEWDQSGAAYDNGGNEEYYGYDDM